MRRLAQFEITALGICLLLIGSVAAFNFFVDASNIFLDYKPWKSKAISTYVRKLAQSDQGMPYIGRDRLVKYELVHRRDADCYIVGSSRVMTVARDDISILHQKCSASLNLAISDSSMEDTQMMIGQIIAKSGRPLILIGVDPWSFSIDHIPDYRELDGPFYKARADMGILPRDETAAGTAPSLAGRLLSLDYLHRNVREIWRSVLKPSRKARLQGAGVDATTPVIDVKKNGRLLSDGRLGYPQSVLEVDPMRPLPERGERVPPPPFVNPIALAEWRKMLGFLTQRGYRIVFLLVPYNPRVWACGDANICEGMQVAERVATEFAREFKLPVVGGFDPSRFGLTPADFFDKIHPQPSSVKKLHRRLIEI